MVVPPAPPGFEGTGRTTEKTAEPMTPPKNPLPEQVKPEPGKNVEPKKDEPKSVEKKQETIPLIPLEPRKTPTIDTNGNQPPPLPPPPEVPNFDESNKSLSYEWLPSPSERPRTAHPVFPKDSGIVQAGYQTSESTALTSPPPASWRQKVTSGMIVVDYTNEPPIKLSRPIIVK